MNSRAWSLVSSSPADAGFIGDLDERRLRLGCNSAICSLNGVDPDAETRRARRCGWGIAVNAALWAHPLKRVG